MLRIGHNRLSFPYKIADSNITAEPSCRDIGVNLSNNLSFSDPCNKIAEAAHFRRRRFQPSFACMENNFQVSYMESYGVSIFYRLSIFDKLDDVQRKFNKYLEVLYNMFYPQGLNYLGV